MGTESTNSEALLVPCQVYRMRKLQGCACNESTSSEALLVSSIQNEKIIWLFVY